jgi:hypothetical protein
VLFLVATGTSYCQWQVGAGVVVGLVLSDGTTRVRDLHVRF